MTEKQYEEALFALGCKDVTSKTQKKNGTTAFRLPDGKTHKAISVAMKDVETFPAFKTKPTYFSPYPMARLDHIFVTPELIPESVQVIDTRLAKVASDHRPLLTTLNLKTKVDPLLVNQLHENQHRPSHSPDGKSLDAKLPE